MAIDPKWEPKDNYTDYDELVDSWKYDIVDNATVGSYQGDYLYVLRDPADNQIGFVVIGYGSCSGCDTLQAIQGSKEEIKKYNYQLHSEIHWEADWNLMCMYLCAKDHGGAWYVDEETINFFKRILRINPIKPVLSDNSKLLLNSNEVPSGILADCLEENEFRYIPSSLRNQHAASLCLKLTQYWLINKD